MSKKGSSNKAKLFSLFSVTSSDEDVRLIKRIQKGDEAAFEEFYLKYRKPLFSYFSGHASSVSLAEELLQETFLKVAQNCAGFAFESKVSTWLWAIARNKMIDHWRSAQHQQDQLSESLTTDEGEEHDLAAEIDSAESSLIQQSQTKAVEKCLDELAPNQKDAVLLRSHSELSYDEIAHTLSLSVSAIKSLLVRAKDKLMNCLKRGGHHEA